MNVDLLIRKIDGMSNEDKIYILQSLAERYENEVYLMTKEATHLERDFAYVIEENELLKKENVSLGEQIKYCLKDNSRMWCLVIAASVICFYVGTKV